MILIDTSFVVAFHNTRDVHHRAAATAMTRLTSGEWEKILLPEYVVLEMLTVLRARRDLRTAVSVTQSWLASREVELIACSEYFLDSLEVFRTERKVPLSFTDAAIIAIARRLGVEHVATFDADFRQIRGVNVFP